MNARREATAAAVAHANPHLALDPAGPQAPEARAPNGMRNPAARVAPDLVLGRQAAMSVIADHGSAPAVTDRTARRQTAANPAEGLAVVLPARPGSVTSDANARAAMPVVDPHVRAPARIAVRGPKDPIGQRGGHVPVRKSRRNHGVARAATNAPSRKGIRSRGVRSAEGSAAIASACRIRPMKGSYA